MWTLQKMLKLHLILQIMNQIDHWKNKKVTGLMKDGLGKKIMIKFVGLRVKTYSYLKALKQPSQKIWSKILTPYFLYINLYLTFLRSCCENIFKIICIVSRKLENKSQNLPYCDF